MKKLYQRYKNWKSVPVPEIMKDLPQSPMVYGENIIRKMLNQELNYIGYQMIRVDSDG